MSTHGLGVPYLHVRIDSVPKYYHFAEYKAEKNPEDEDSSQNSSNEPSKNYQEHEDQGNPPPIEKSEPKTNESEPKIETKTPQKPKSSATEQEPKENAASTEYKNDKLLLIGSIGGVILLGIIIFIFWPKNKKH